MTALDVQYECPLAGKEHDLLGPDVRVMRVGDGGFVVACNCSEEPLEDADEQPHPTDKHIVNVYAEDPSPEEWVALEEAANGWYDTTRWHSPDRFGGTHGQRRANFREKMKEIADENDTNERGGTDESHEAARGVACPDCDAGAGQKCKRPSGHRVRKSHSERVAKAREQGVIETEGDENPSEQAPLEDWS